MFRRLKVGCWRRRVHARGMDILTLELPGVRKIASGKVREIFDLGEHLLLVATDRISAFDCIPCPTRSRARARS